ASVGRATRNAAHGTRETIRRNPTADKVYRTGVGVVGGSTVALGVVMIPRVPCAAFRVARPTDAPSLRTVLGVVGTSSDAPLIIAPYEGESGNHRESVASGRTHPCSQAHLR
ncbi:hypothetical protein ACC691_37385, partial [Rhizobium johnstonii]|uniref:hypothetical protein n=1 Tax=Rhizobium johnstonii TaxID=3019933 RepID=UPI003F99628D